jgi:Flp pilus assembly protein TadG
MAIFMSKISLLEHLTSSDTRFALREPKSMRKRRVRQGGQSLVEASLVFLMFIFMFIGVLDFGFYAYSMISVQSAARVAALYTASSKNTAGDNAGACAIALKELATVVNIGPTVTTCNALPLVVTATSSTDPSTNLLSSTVSVQYQSVLLIPIPGILTNQLTITRIVEFPVLS